MLSEQDKKEMLEDARSKARRDDFRAIAARPIDISFDEYIKALDDLQKIFVQFKTPVHVAPTKLNKL